MPFGTSPEARVRRAIRLALNELGREGVAGIRASINIPTVRVGSRIIRSEPGEEPRRETPDVSEHPGQLWKSIKYKVAAGARTTQHLSLRTFCSYAPSLEYGTEHMEPRPFWRKGERQFKRGIRARFKAKVARILRNEDPMADFPAEDVAFNEDDWNF